MTPTAALLAFALITMTAITVEILYTYATQGFGFGFSSNRPRVDRTPMGLRIERTYRNQAESAAYIVPVLAAAAVLGLDSAAAQTTAAIIVAGRAAFVALYYTGLPFIRILGFGAGSFGTLFLAYLVVTALATT
ncbi:MAPEG family protein [uncultured Tateyamaria sp.]|uniref:MAPEG family protein n=1 Tax=uncultured Tateyamaria sp. TaxID=455651 RepID=UPI00262374B9|nr:MAPEG family protein [uncultured Tateyamaria sp.]